MYVCASVISGASVFLHLHCVLAPSGVCDRSVPHSVAPVWFLAGWYTHRGLVHPQQVGNRCMFMCEHETVKGGDAAVRHVFDSY